MINPLAGLAALKLLFGNQGRRAMKVLTIDPNQDMRDMISVAFRLHWEGVKVIEAGGGGEGLLLVEEEKPDIVILELELPDIDGMELCHRILRRYHVPMVVLSLRGDEEDIVRALRAGASDYIIKPFQPRELVARVEAVARRHRRSFQCFNATHSRPGGDSCPTSPA